MAKLSPMMEQYFSIKEQHQEHILFFRLGDFYEMFYDDAIKVSQELELTLTGRDCGQEERAPMCGVPYHSCDAYIARLIKKGYKVAICEQVEDIKGAKGIVKREVVRVVTPGTLVETNMLDEGANNFIGSVFLRDGTYGLAMADISTGEIHATEFFDSGDAKINNELSRFAPNEVVFNTEIFSKPGIGAFIKTRLNCCAECILDEEYESEKILSLVMTHFKATNISELGLDDKPHAMCAIGGLIHYLQGTQMVGVNRLITLSLYSDMQFMMLDITARRNLELTETMRAKEKRGSLLWVLDRTKTAMGKRLMRQYLEQPLLNPATINRRLSAVEELVQKPIMRDDIRCEFGGVHDLERLMTKIIFGNCTPRDLKTFEYTLKKLPELKGLIRDVKATNLTEIYAEIDPLEDVAATIASAILEDPPANLKDGWVIADGFNAELDEIRSLVTNTKQYLAEIETSEREETGIKNLKISYNKVFGYYMEVTRSYQEMVPERYIRKQTLANCERYITQELKELEEKILTASEKMLTLENGLFAEVREMISVHLHRIQQSASAVARLDVFASLAQVAQDFDYTKPQITVTGELIIEDGRHPVVEQLLSDIPFVSNSLHLNKTDSTVAIITGPNMAGKSTYMRQCAIIVLMAQIGSFVPAASATIGIIDGIFTRVGASDDLSTGQSTFMVEMNEVADILKTATQNSLLILDEIGRGTSTYDGMSIARAVIEYIADKKKLGSKTLFATHYHELTVLEESLPSVKNFNIACRKNGEEIVFLRKIVPGGADESYGIEVSKLAGIPQQIIKRAFEILAALETGEPVREKKLRKNEALQAEQLTFALAESRVEAELQKVDVNSLSPIDALNKLFELKAYLKK